MTRLSPALAATVVAALLAACGSAGGGLTGGGATGGGATGGGATGGDRARAQRATQLLDRYAATSVASGSPRLALGDQLEQQDGDWEPAVGENAKLAWPNGHLVAVGPLPQAPRQGKGLTGSGRGVSTAIISAADAFTAMTARRTDCGGCTDLRVTGATLTSMDVRTSRGTVRVPAWRFALEGTAVTLLRVAVPASGLVRTPLDWTPAPGDGSRAESFELGRGGRTLTLTFTGAPDQPGPCGADYRGQAFESDRAVVVAVVEVPRPSTTGAVACPAIGAVRTVDVTLQRVLGDRTVLSLADAGVVVQGPVRVEGTPAR